MRRTSLASIALCVASTGCSLIVDTDPYLGDVNGQTPTTPEIRITPDEPRTNDVLTVEIVTPSVDPANQGEVKYEYAWRVDDTETSITTNTVPAEQTERGQVWTATVTPVSSDGTRRGTPATATVTIMNSPPVIATVGLTQYRPIEGETLQAFTGAMVDADGDAVSIRYTWLRNGVVLEGRTANRLDLGAIGAQAGDQIEVQVSVRDGMNDGNTVSAGPAIVLENVTRWRQLLPERQLSGASVGVFDRANRRVLLAYYDWDSGSAELWEYSLDAPSPGFVQLHPTGPRPGLFGAKAIYDEANRRVLFVAGHEDVDSGLPINQVFSLDISRRGAESWELLIEGGPSPRYLPNVAYDAKRSRILFHGGFELDQESFAWIDDFWVLDLSTPGAETWTEVSLPLPSSPVAGAGFIVDAERDRALLIGGADPVADDLSVATTIYSLNLADLGDGFQLTPVSLPRPVMLPTMGIDGGTAFVFFGLRNPDNEEYYSDLIEIDLESMSTSQRSLTEEDGPVGGFGFVERDPAADRLIVYIGAPPTDSEALFAVYGYDRTTADFSPIHRTGVDLPGPLERSIVSATSDGIVIYGGIDHNGAVEDDLWRWAGSSWMRVETMPDLVTGNSPGPRAGVVTQTNTAFIGDLQFFGGVGPNGTADGQMWLLHDNRWIEQTLETGAVAPTPREGAMLWVPACGTWQAGYFGGHDFTGPFSDQGVFWCSSGERNCTWHDPVGTAPKPPARSYGTIVRPSDGTLAILFGGFDATYNVSNQIWAHNACSWGPEPWHQVQPTTPPPPPRMGHSATLLEPGPPGSVPTIVVFGGSGSGYGGSALNDLWKLTIHSSGEMEWSEMDVALGPNDPMISPRYHHAAAYDRMQQRVLVYGGRGRGWVARSDMWELHLGP